MTCDGSGGSSTVNSVRGRSNLAARGSTAFGPAFADSSVMSRAYGDALRAYRKRRPARDEQRFDLTDETSHRHTAPTTTPSGLHASPRDHRHVVPMIRPSPRSPIAFPWLYLTAFCLAVFLPPVSYSASRSSSMLMSSACFIVFLSPRSAMDRRTNSDHGHSRSFRRSGKVGAVVTAKGGYDLGYAWKG